MPTDSHARASQPNNYPPPPAATYYDLLQVSPKAEPEIIEAAYRKLALRYHPDHNPSPQARSQMQALNEAYNVLKDPQRRALYDQELLRPFYTGYSDDFSEDDYEPPLRRRPAAGTGQIIVALLVVALAGVLIWWLAHPDSQAAFSTTPVAPLPTVSLPPGTLFFDDFESVAGANWRLDPPWHLTSRYSHSGKYSLWFGKEDRGSYSPNLSAAASLVRSVNLGETAHPTLSFWLSGQSDHEQNPTGEDRLFVEAAAPGQDFQTIFTANGLYSNWQQINLDLSDWQGQAVLLRFRFVSGSLNSGAGFSGFFVDDVRVGPAN